MRATCCINPVRASTTQRPRLTPSENYESRDLRSPVAKLKSQQARTDAPRVSLCASPHLESLNDILVFMKNRVKSPFRAEAVWKSDIQWCAKAIGKVHNNVVQFCYSRLHNYCQYNLSEIFLIFSLNHARLEVRDKRQLRNR